MNWLIYPSPSSPKLTFSSISSHFPGLMSLPAITGHLDKDKAYHVFPPWLSPHRASLLAYIASIVQTGAGYPMDTIKVKMQAYRSYTGYADCIKQTYESQGVRGFFRGILSPLLSTSLVRTLNVTIFSSVKSKVAELIPLGDFAKDHPYYANIPISYISGAFAGFNTTVISCPFEYVKVAMQLQRASPAVATAPTLSQVVKLIIQYDGFRGLYSGWKYHAMRDSIGSGVYFATYESMKMLLNKLINGDASKPSQISILVAGGLSGISGWCFVYPIDTLKQRYQKGTVQNLFRQKAGEKRLHVDAGKWGYSKDMFRGIGIQVTRSVLVNMIFFSMYEMMMANLI